MLRSFILRKVDWKALKVDVQPVNWVAFATLPQFCQFYGGNFGNGEVEGSGETMMPRWDEPDGLVRPPIISANIGLISSPILPTRHSG